MFLLMLLGVVRRETGELPQSNLSSGSKESSHFSLLLIPNSFFYHCPTEHSNNFAESPPTIPVSHLQLWRNPPVRRWLPLISPFLKAITLPPGGPSDFFSPSILFLLVQSMCAYDRYRHLCELTSTLLPSTTPPS